MEIQKKIRKMKGREFEFFCKELLKELGYKSKVTDSTNDGEKIL
nr:restriction endonuclease [Clostridium sporogenes]